MDETVDGFWMHGGYTHSLLECRGCETVFYEISSWNSEDYDQWYDAQGEVQTKYLAEVRTYPKPASKSRPVWLDKIDGIDKQLHRILDQMYIALDGGAIILAAIGLRTALDRGTELLGINPSLSFKAKLDELLRRGLIGQGERDILDVVTDAGHAAAHRGWEPGADQFEDLLLSLEAFFYRTFIVGKAALDLKSAIPKKPPRSSAEREAKGTSVERPNKDAE